MTKPGDEPSSPLGRLAWSALLNAVLVAAFVAGVAPAILFHDYGGTILFVGFLFAFSMFAQRWILESQASEVEVSA